MDSKQNLAAYTSIEKVGWVAVTSLPRAVLLYDINRFQLFCLILTFGISLGAALIARNLTRKLTKPFDQYISVLTSYIHDDYEPKCEDSGIEQIEAIGRQINVLGESLEEKEHQLSDARNTMHEMTTLDARTRLSTRSAIYNKIAQLFGHTPNQALALMDISGYKPLVSLYGQAFGSSLLEAVAQILMEYRRGGTYIARLGDDDFLLFFSNFKSEEDVLEQLKQIMKDVHSISTIKGQEVKLDANIGIVYLDETITSRTVWMRQADEAKYQAKNSSKHYHIHESHPDAPQQEPEYWLMLSQKTTDSGQMTGDVPDFFIAGDSRGESVPSPEPRRRQRPDSSRNPESDNKTSPADAGSGIRISQEPGAEPGARDCKEAGSGDCKKSDSDDDKKAGSGDCEISGSKTCGPAGPDDDPAAEVFRSPNTNSPRPLKKFDSES